MLEIDDMVMTKFGLHNSLLRFGISDHTSAASSSSSSTVRACGAMTTSRTCGSVLSTAASLAALRCVCSFLTACSHPPALPAIAD